MKTTVVNINKDKCDIYIGRSTQSHIPEYPQKGWAGNPYNLKDWNRTESIQRYREYFYDRIEKDEIFRAGILSLRGKTLGCFCKPLSCHGDIIAEYLNNLRHDQ